MLESLLSDGFSSLDLIEEYYARYLQDPSSVDPRWAKLFSQFDIQENKNSAPSSISEKTQPGIDSSVPRLIPEEIEGRSVLYYPRVELGTHGPDLRIAGLIDAYRRYGYLAAAINPIEIKPIEEPESLKYESHGFTRQDLSVHFPTYGLLNEEQAPLLDIINALKAVYCDKIGFEYMGIHSKELEQWLQQKIEDNHFRLKISIEQKKIILQHLNKSELFESFIHTKYVGQKRFSLEGAETLIPVLASIIDHGAANGIDEYILGMAHRGRLNVLSNIFDKSYADIFSEFEEGYIPASIEGSGDVKYHKGFYSEVKTIHGHSVSLTLTPNPSHLESVDPVVEGQVRGRQMLRGDEVDQKKILPLIIHGDAAISGQGVVYETMQFGQLEGYSTGGTLHIVVNNQIGFTTIPKDLRSTCFCTDIARIFGAPVFHVNAEDPEGCVFVSELALELRQRFNCDVFIELMCYRKYGHNETDEPAFTQPLEYQIIRKKRPIRELYRDSLIRQGVMEKHVAESLEGEFKTALQESLKAKRIPTKQPGILHEKTTLNEEIFQPVETAVSKKLLQEIGAKICHIPQQLTLHPKLIALQKERLAMLQEGEGKRNIDWGMAELLAYGSLLWNGTHVRLSGQDCCRGTFSHRHAMLMDQVKEQEYIPLKHLKPQQGKFEVYNSSLSEFAVLGFEFGYSVACQEALVIWEAQFGDFCNGAQVVIDQYISTSEQKWSQKSGLTLFLPHGYEGQGPEHSSGRMERFLTLAGDNNMQIVNPTTPAQLFHLLRRQILRPFKKPLIVFTPKGLLRHSECVSRLEDFTQGAFQEIIDDPRPSSRPTKLVFCTGRVFYDLAAEREKTGKEEEIALVRIEQLYPLNYESIKRMINRYAGVKECIWVQEEPKNMGAWIFLEPILKECLPKQIELSYIGRARSASPAVGSYAMHKKEYTAMMSALFAAPNL